MATAETMAATEEEPAGLSAVAALTVAWTVARVVAHLARAAAVVVVAGAAVVTAAQTAMGEAALVAERVVGREALEQRAYLMRTTTLAS